MAAAIVTVVISATIVTSVTTGAIAIVAIAMGAIARAAVSTQSTMTNAPVPVGLLTERAMPAGPDIGLPAAEMATTVIRVAIAEGSGRGGARRGGQSDRDEGGGKQRNE